MKARIDAETLLELYRPDLSRMLAEYACPSYRYAQVYEYLLRHPLQPFAQATMLPAEMRSWLDESGVSSLETAARSVSSDGTEKLLLKTSDSAHIETVVMPYRRRTTLCLSSQVGCPVGCAFCATGAMGFSRNLSVTEIVDQVRIAAASLSETSSRVSNLVFMGMGEPLLNLQAVLRSIQVLTAPRGMDLAHRSISVSTIGVPAGIVRLARAEPQVNLAISLHAPSDQTRALLVPEKHRHPIEDILEAAWEHFALTRRKLLIEYVLLSRVNDSAKDARRLASLLKGHVVTVNLLAWNAVDPLRNSPARGSGKRRNATERTDFLPSPPAAVAAFRDVLAELGIEVVVRRSRGSDIEAACGQLAGRLASYG